MKRRDLDFQNFDQILEDIDSLHQQGYTKLGEWNLAQALEHLRLTMESATKEKSFGIPKIAQLVLRLVFLRSLLSTRKMKAGFSTSKKLIPKNPIERSLEVEAKEIEAFRATVENFRTHNGEYLPNPAFGKISREEWQEVQKIHCSHHLSFLVPNSSSP